MSSNCKKLVNSCPNCVRENLEGLVLQHSDILQLTTKQNIILSTKLKNASGKVLLLSGGGSGHEPTFGGFVGDGMLSAAVAGEIFTSPTPESVLVALKILGKYSTAGILIIINNYTGDRLNFGLAMGRAKAKGINVKMLVNHDDCALQSKDKSAGRRGVAGSLLAIKIAGAMAKEGKTLDEIYSFCSTVLDNIGTIGVGLSGCSVPGVGSSFTLKSDEIELGLGIHGEAGITRLKLGTAKEMVKIMIDHMISEKSATRFNLVPGDNVAVFLNNLGGTSQLEMNIVLKEVVEYLGTLGATIECVITGTLMTALEMAGVSISILKLNASSKKYLDDKTEAPAWPNCSRNFTLHPLTYNDEEENVSQVSLVGCEQKLSTKNGSMLREIILEVSNVMQENESILNDLDRESGDGDCGSTMKRGFEAISKFLESETDIAASPKLLLLRVSDLMESSMGGSSGALYSIFCTGASQAFNSNSLITPNNWKEALKLGLEDICKFGGAEPGDRTMVDPMSQFLNALPNLNDIQLQELEVILEKAIIKAEQNAIETSTMLAKAGRASYVDKTLLKRPDPGAYAVSIWLRAAFESWKRQRQ